MRHVLGTRKRENFFFLFNLQNFNKLQPALLEGESQGRRCKYQMITGLRWAGVHRKVEMSFAEKEEVPER